MTGRVIFRVAAPSPLTASTRYRAMMPAIGLEALGYHCTVTAQALGDEELRKSACIVFAKAFRAEDVEAARRAHALGVPIVLDICDHMFFPEYGDGRGEAYADAFRTMAALARTIVTTGPALADVVATIAPGAAIAIIPDQVETPDLLARVLDRAKQWPRRSFAERVATAVRDPHALMKRLSAAQVGMPVDRRRQRQNEAPTLVWFGNHGAGHSRFGLEALAPLVSVLTDIARHRPLRLLVVSNSREKFNRTFANATFETEYREWSPTRIFSDISEASVCLLPAPQEPFTRCKSANRVVLALSRGAAVVASAFPALADFSECVIADDWRGGIELYLTDENLRQAHLAKGRDIIARSYSASVVAGKWAHLIEAIQDKGA